MLEMSKISFICDCKILRCRRCIIPIVSDYSDRIIRQEMDMVVIASCMVKLTALFPIETWQRRLRTAVSIFRRFSIMTVGDRNKNKKA